MVTEFSPEIMLIRLAKFCVRHQEIEGMNFSGNKISKIHTFRDTVEQNNI